VRKHLIGALSATSLAVCGPALAAPTLVGTTTNASGIDGVVVNSVTYDVTFSTASFGSTFSTAKGGSEASIALAADLNTLSVTGLSIVGASGFDCRTVLLSCVIFAGSSSQLAETVAGIDSPPNFWGGDATRFAEFLTAVSPDPG
jgi:hypothetical protein